MFKILTIFIVHTNILLKENYCKLKCPDVYDTIKPRKLFGLVAGIKFGTHQCVYESKNVRAVVLKQFSHTLLNSDQDN